MALVPSGNDRLAPAAGRAMVFPYWFGHTADKNADAVHAASRYFDSINFAPRIKAPLLIGVGLRDRSCPPSGIFAMVNHVNGFKEVSVLRDSAHQNHNGAQDIYNRRLDEVWLPALQTGSVLPSIPAGVRP